MEDWFDLIGDNAATLGWLAAASVLLFLASLVAGPLLVIRMPHDYFAHDRRHRPLWAEEHLLVRATVLVVKNALGALLVMAGMAMLLLPGQGIITMLAGILLLDFPGKFHLERWLVSRGPTLRAINWLRHRAGREPLVFD